jgi:hypothetical protein
MRPSWRSLPHARTRRSGGLLLAATLLMALPATAAADAPPGPYFNGFEMNTAGWNNFNGGTITQVASGSSGTYANGVSAATGNYYARLGKDPSPSSCTFGGGTASVYSGPYTDFGGYASTFPMGGYSTGVDIYLDVPFAQTHPDTRFDWSSAINNTAGGFRRDFVFNVGTDALGFVVNGGNNSTRCGANPYGGASIHIIASGWYTFQHDFSGVAGGPLVVTLTVKPAGTNVVLGTWIRSDASDIIGLTVGGNRYGWFVQNEFDGLAIDNSFRTGIGDPAFLTLSPAAATNVVGTEHCVTATVTDASGNRTPDITVEFSVPTAPTTNASPSSDSAMTDSNGQATFCYSASLPGQDTITAFADTDEDGMRDVDEPMGTATKTWTPPPSTELCEVKITDGGWIIADNGDRSSFGGNSRSDANGTASGQQEFQDHGPAQPLNAHSTRITAITCTSDRTQATIFGEATIDGTDNYVFRIDLSDLGSPGSSDTYGILLSNGYNSGVHTLSGGNITIH